ncbi:GumN family protein [Salmonella enterica subsp. enterica]|uniref:GumN family protein n=1 Tax=Salmonella enterica I TaxID=59201 RepID=A0A3S4JI08_SALET|nr:GumN family protein [Salmonella enterica subsp. enterica]
MGLRPDYGIDYQLLQAAREMSLPVQELEGAKHQLELLCDLPDGGMALLDDTLTHWPHQRTAFAGDDRLVA